MAVHPPTGSLQGPEAPRPVVSVPDDLFSLASQTHEGLIQEPDQETQGSESQYRRLPPESSIQMKGRPRVPLKGI